jgi:formate hydrogenlyase subunit 4
MQTNFFFWFIWFAAGLICAPVLPGIINKVKAFFAGRKGPSVFQLYYDLAKLLRKESIVSTTSGGVIALAPYIILATLLGAALFLPYGAVKSPFTFTGDVILFFYLLGTSRVAMIFGALDTGSAFEGMG